MKLRVFRLAVILTTGAYATSSVAQLAPPRQYTISPTNVNLLDNTYAFSVTDLEIGPLKLERSYLGGPATGNYSKTFGWGWDHNYDIWATASIVKSQWLTKVVIGRQKYLYDGNGNSNAPRSDEVGTIAKTVNGVFSFTDRDGTVYSFAGTTNSNGAVAGSAANIISPDGSSVTITYASDKPKTIVSNRGFALVLDYGTNGFVKAACAYNLSQTYVSLSTTCDTAVLKTSYTYSGGLTGVYDVLGNLTSYSYNTTSQGSMTCVTAPGSSTCKVTNSYAPGHYDISQQTMADGSTWQYNCSCSANGKGDESSSFPDDYSGWTQPDGYSFGFNFSNAVPVSYLDQRGKQYLTSFYGRYLVQETLPEGNKVNFNYSSRLSPNGNTFIPKPSDTSAPINQGTGTFPSSCTNTITCNRPSTVSDANGNVTTYVYDPIHGGVLTETGPNNSAGIAAVVRHSYAQRYAWILNAGGGYSQAATPVWVVTEDRTCRSTATSGNSCVGGSADEVITTYDYGPNSGPNNLFLRGKVVTSGGVSYRTCYGYDWMGNKISETQPRANLASCS